ncbi:MAG: glycerol acyltransferase [Ferruginibacter sp.]|nr:glycerol acyltransferase [Ferruginibacter sp.]
MPSYYPPTGFHFKVEFQGVSGMGTDTEQRFQDVSGLSFEIETEPLREGGENRFEYKLPKRTKYSNLVLKRGLLTDSAIIDWMKSAMSTFYTVVVYDFKPADIMITLLDEADEPVAIWNVVQAYPLKWSVSDFKSTENAVVVETMELAYQYFERKM